MAADDGPGAFDAPLAPPEASCVPADAGANAFPSNNVLAIGAPLPNFTFDVVAPGGASLRPESMRRHHRPCGPSNLLVLRASAAWCGPCGGSGRSIGSDAQTKLADAKDGVHA